MSKELYNEFVALMQSMEKSGEIQEQLFQDPSCLNESYRKWNDDSTNEFLDKLTTAGITLKEEDSYGGEGQGDDYWVVYSITKGSDFVYIKFDGCYASYVGSEFIEYFMVEPRPVTKTEYFKVKN